MLDISLEIAVFLIRMITVFLVLCSSVSAQGLIYDASEILGFESKTTETLPTTCQPNEVFIKYDGWSLNELRKKIRERQDVEIEFWHTVEPYADRRMKPGVYRLIGKKPDWQHVRFTWAEKPAQTVLVAAAAFAHKIQTGRNLFADAELDPRMARLRHNTRSDREKLFALDLGESKFLNVCRENFHGRGLLMEWTNDKRLYISHSSESHIQDAQQVCRHLFNLTLNEKQVEEIGPPPTKERRHTAVLYDPGWSLERMSQRFSNHLAVEIDDETLKGEWFTKEEEPRYRRISLITGDGGRTIEEQREQLKEDEVPISARVAYLTVVALKAEGSFFERTFDVRTGDVLPDGRRIMVNFNANMFEAHHIEDFARTSRLVLGSMDK